jgi:hypothetical protein
VFSTIPTINVHFNNGGTRYAFRAFPVILSANLLLRILFFVILLSVVRATREGSESV